MTLLRIENVYQAEIELHPPAMATCGNATMPRRPRRVDDCKGTWSIGDQAVSLDEVRAANGARRGRPVGGANKVSTTIRFDADVLDAFRAMGDGWQTRINDALKQWLASR